MQRLLVLVLLLGLVGSAGPGVGPAVGPGVAVRAAGDAGAAGPVGPVPPVPVPVGVFGWPLAGVDPTGPPAPGSPGRVTRRFLAPPTPYGRGHRGADLAADPGTPVLAAGAGRVAFAGSLAGRGVVSVVHPGGLRTTYEPVTPVVAVGAAVGRGDRVGLLAAGHPGCPAPACLHWGLRGAGDGGVGSGGPGSGGEVYLDPLLLLGLGRVRLLPWGPDP